MKVIIFWFGLIWAIIGVANIAGAAGQVSSGWFAFGMILNFVLFIFPGLVLVGLGKSGFSDTKIA